MSKISSGVKKVFLGAGAMLLVLLLSLFLAFSRFGELERENNANARTYRTLLLTQEAARAMIDMETGNRGFLLTGKDEFREPFNKGRDAFKARYADLKKLTENSADQQKRLTTIKAKLTLWFKLYNPAIQARRNTNDAREILRIANSNAERRKNLVDDIRVLIGQVKDTENKRLAQVNARRSSLQFLSRSTLAVNAVLATLFVGGLAFGLARQARQIESSNEELRREAENRKRFERERRVLAEHNEQILNSTIEGIVGLNIKGRITYINPAASQLLGWDNTELIGKPWHDFAQHSNANSVRADKDQSPIMTSLRDGRARRVSDEVFWKREGKNFPVEFAVTPLFELDSNGQQQQIGATLTFRDVTERKRSEIALIRLASIVESSKDAILSHLPNGTIVSCNAAAVRLYGYAARELENQALTTLFPPSRQEEATLIVDHMGKGERIEPYQTTVVTKSGERIDVALTFYPVRDAKGNLMGASSNARPVRQSGTQGNILPTFDAMRHPTKTVNGAANGTSNSAREAVGTT